jgi:hypothetical protein
MLEKRLAISEQSVWYVIIEQSPWVFWLQILHSKGKTTWRQSIDEKGQNDT